MSRGFMGKILWVDLSSNSIQVEELEENLGRRFIGGYGLGARILYSRQKAGVDPLGPDNILGIITGVLTGTAALGSSRYAVVGKSPLTGGWGDANSGGSFGPYLKFAGYDAVFFTGISPKPVYLVIDNGKAEIRAAAGIWGKDSFETEDILKAELGRDAEIACIGPSGEKVSLIAAVMNNKGRAAARSGLGAVMGSKKLKAVAVKGNMKVPVADEKLVADLRKKYLPELAGPAIGLRESGTVNMFNFAVSEDDAPTKNWGGVTVIDFPEYDLIGAEAVLERQSKKYACYRCPIGCGGHMKEGTGEYKYEAGAHKPEYETLGMFGSNCLNTNLESIIKANDICNRSGLDVISTGSTISFAMECYERGLITKADMDGIELTWGNHQAIVAMTEKLARREGLGNILADGVRLAAEKIGGDAEKYAIHVQGQEVPAHDPRAGYQWAICYRLDPTPARHTEGGEGPYPPGLLPEFDLRSFEGRGMPHKIGSVFGNFYNSAGTCMFVLGSLPHIDAYVESLNAVTGWDMNMDEILEAGERILDMRQAFNIREGLNPIQFKFPDRIMGRPPKSEGPLKGITLEEDIVNNEYLATLDWDIETAKPSKKKLLELGLEDVAKELWP